MSGSPRNKPFPQAKLSTVFLRVPTADWLAVTRGAKTEFRSQRGHVTQAWRMKLPTPVVCYQVKRCQEHEAKLMVLEKTWREPLGSISEESLTREGFNVEELGRERAYQEFRRYMRNRERRPFRPLQEVQVYQVRPWGPGDGEGFGGLLLERLYGEFL